jgi:hypothetical protein
MSISQITELFHLVKFVGIGLEKRGNCSGQLDVNAHGDALV